MIQRGSGLSCTLGKSRIGVAVQQSTATEAVAWLGGNSKCTKFRPPRHLYDPSQFRCGGPRVQVASLVTPRGPVWPASRAAWAQAIIPRHKLQNRDPHSPRRMGKELRHLCTRAACRSRSPICFIEGFAKLFFLHPRPHRLLLRSTGLLLICMPSSSPSSSESSHRGICNRLTRKNNGNSPKQKKMYLKRKAPSDALQKQSYSVSWPSCAYDPSNLKKRVFKLYTQVLFFKLYMRFFKTRMVFYQV